VHSGPLWPSKVMPKIKTKLQHHSEDQGCDAIEVDVIVPVHNASETLVATIESALAQILPDSFLETWWGRLLSIHVCCYDDGSTDDSWKILQHLHKKYESGKSNDRRNNSCHAASRKLPTVLWIDRSETNAIRGPGFARNRAVEMRVSPLIDESDSNHISTQRFLCMLDSDDVMHETRVAEQLAFLLNLPPGERSRTLLGCTFARDPPDSTWHYAQWANGLTDERLLLERFREVTVLQPTWMMSRSRFVVLGGYIEAPTTTAGVNSIMHRYNGVAQSTSSKVFRLIHPTFDTIDSLRIAEDLRFFHAHIHDKGLLRLLRTTTPLLTYRHRINQSQSSLTSRQLLLQLRALALERCVLCVDPVWQGSFCIWGAGRDGKEALKAMHPDVRKRVVCFADVDDKKINIGYYVNRQLDLKIPIVHFSLLVSDPEVRNKLMESWQQGDDSGNRGVGRIDKSRPTGGEHSIDASAPPVKKRRLHSIGHLDDLDLDVLPKLPVLVCVAMYRTNGALEYNVSRIGRTEGNDLWHFC
jgi:glycosyltransferase involved in cell wall biosynthesis